MLRFANKKKLKEKQYSNISLQTCEVIKVVELVTRDISTHPQHTVMLAVGQHSLWVAIGNTIHILSSKVTSLQISSLVSSSLRLFVSSSLRLFVSSSLRLFVSSSLRLFVSSSLRLFVSSSLRLFVSSSP